MAGRLIESPARTRRGAGRGGTRDGAAHGPRAGAERKRVQCRAWAAAAHWRCAPASGWARGECRGATAAQALACAFDSIPAAAAAADIPSSTAARAIHASRHARRTGRLGLPLKVHQTQPAMMSLQCSAGAPASALALALAAALARPRCVRCAGGCGRVSAGRAPSRTTGWAVTLTHEPRTMGHELWAATGCCRHQVVVVVHVPRDRDRDRGRVGVGGWQTWRAVWCGWCGGGVWARLLPPGVGRLH